MTILRARGLVKRFGGLPAVDDVDLDVEAGEILAVIGPNGAGKTTLLQLLNGMTAPSSSAGIVFRGTELSGLPPHRIRHLGIATVLQVPRLFPHLSVLDNVALGAMFGRPARQREADARERAAAELARLGMAEVIDLPVDGLTLQQRRTVELARALAGDPRLLLLDEVMAGLNPAEVDDYVELVRDVRERLGVSVVWVEHVMRAVNALADRVLVLHVGRVLAQGPTAQVMREPAVADAYLGREVEHRAGG